MSTFRFTLVESAQDNSVNKVGSKTPESFIESLVERGHRPGNKDGSAIIAATFMQGGKRDLAHVESVTGLILDIDGKFKREGVQVQEAVDPDWLISQLPFIGVAHTSYNNTPTMPKYRIILPAAEPMTVEQHRRLWYWVFEKLQHKIDPACKDASRLFYLPRAPKEAIEQGWHWVRPLRGPLISYRLVPDDFVVPHEGPPPGMAKPKPPKGMFLSNDKQHWTTDARKTLDALRELPIFRWAYEDPSAVGRDVWRGLGVNIAAAVLEEEAMWDEGSAYFHELSEQDPDRYNWNVTEKTFRDALKSAREYGAVTYERMAEYGAPDEVCQPQTDGAKAPVVDARRQVRSEERQNPKAGAPVGAESASPGAQIPAAQQSNSAAPQQVLVEMLPPTDGGTVDDDEEDFDGFKKDNYLYDACQNRWLIRSHKSGEWYGPVPDVGFTQLLEMQGMTSKNIKPFKAACRAFVRTEAVWDSTERYVVKDGVGILNTYKPSKLTPKQGDFPLIRSMLLNLVGEDPDGLEYLLDWLAAPLQSVWLGVPDGKGGRGPKGPLKLGTALVLYGEQGSGKGTLGTILQQLYGEDNVSIIGQSGLDGKFNGMLVDKLFVVANEVISSTNRSMETANKLKMWVTDPLIPIERKRIDEQLIQNTFNICLTSNDDRPVLLEGSDRRFSVFYSKKFDTEIAAKIYADLAGDKIELCAFLDFLLARKTKIQFGDLYKNERRAAMVRASRTSEEQFADLIATDGWLSVAAPFLESLPSGATKTVVIPEGDEFLVPSAALNEVYRDYCKRMSLKFRHPRFLGSALKGVFPHSDNEASTRVGNVRVRCWKGLPMEGEADVIDIQRVKEHKIAVEATNNKPAESKKTSLVDNPEFE